MKAKSVLFYLFCGSAIALLCGCSAQHMTREDHSWFPGISADFGRGGACEAPSEDDSGRHHGPPIGVTLIICPISIPLVVGYDVVSLPFHAAGHVLSFHKKEGRGAAAARAAEKQEREKQEAEAKKLSPEYMRAKFVSEGKTYWEYQTTSTLYKPGVGVQDFYQVDGQEDFAGKPATRVRFRRFTLAFNDAPYSEATMNRRDEFYSVDSDGIRQRGMVQDLGYAGVLKHSFSPSPLRTPLSISLGQTWKSDFDDHATSNSGLDLISKASETMRVLRAEKVAAAGEEFDSFVIENRSASTDKNGNRYTGKEAIWYAPKLGREVKRVRTWMMPNATEESKEESLLTHYKVGQDWTALLDTMSVGLKEHQAKVAAAVSAGDQAALAGRTVEALARYADALAIASAGGESKEIREKAIQLSLSMDPPPTMPEQARSHANRGESFAKRARSDEDYQASIEEFRQVLAIAPWAAPIYYNLAVVQEKVGDLDGAMDSLRTYLIAAPNAPDVAAVKKKLDDLQVAKEMAAK